MPTFTIVIPVFNIAKYLRECLDSVLLQTFTDWECICVDDGSTDGSGTILDEYAEKDPRYRIIHQSNSGEGAARNAGLAAASGEWVVFLDGDDVLARNALADILSLATPGIELIRFGVEVFDDGKKPSFASDASRENVRDISISKIVPMDVLYTYVWQHAFSHHILNGLEFKRYKRGCDRVFLCDILLNRACSVRVVDLPLYGYRMRCGSAMNSMPTLQVLLDEMDHRLDIAEMADDSGKAVDYAGNPWLERYFTRAVPQMISRSCQDANDLDAAWRRRIPRFLSLRGFSTGGRLSVRAASVSRSRLWLKLVCRWLPGTFSIGANKSRLRKVCNALARLKFSCF